MGTNARANSHLQPINLEPTSQDKEPLHSDKFKGKTSIVCLIKIISKLR